MSSRRWLGFTDTVQEDEPSQVEIAKRSTQLLDSGERRTLRVNYTVSGAWEGDLNGFQEIEIPGATHVEEEGAPAVPKDGIFIAIPVDAEDVSVQVVDKTMYNIEGDLSLNPAPKQFIEEEFQEVYEPNASIYESDEPYPGRDFDFLGVKTIYGLKVAHILVYLGQYRPSSRRMDLVQSLVLEVSFRTPPAQDRHPGRKPRQLPSADLILGVNLLDEESDFDSQVEDLEGADPTDVEILEELETLVVEEAQGISELETVESDSSDPSVLPPTQPIIVTRPKLKIKGLISEYIIVTSKALASSVEPLRAAKSGWPFYARVALTEDVSREFPATNLKESIKSFIRWATANWRVPPRFVVLAGDTDVIPIHIYNRGGRTYASDHFYSDLGGDLVPELTVSRLPMSQGATLKAVCQYLVSYGDYRGGDWGGWQNGVMLCAYQASTYETTCDKINDKIKSRYRVTKRYAKNTSKSDVVNTMNQGVLFAVYRGHGSKTAWSSSNGLTTGDVKSLKNSGRPAFVLSVCCQNGWIDDNTLETLAETFIRNRKAVAIFASSRNSWTYPNNDFVLYMFDAIMKGGCQTPAEIINYAKTKMVRNHGSSSYHLDNTVMYNLMGDPTADVASNAEYLRGDWAMDHDGWQGKLKITRIWNYRVVCSGSYCAPVWSISGSYVASNGNSYPFSGTLGGFDSNQLGSGSKRSDHKVDIRIRFSTSNNQHFIGYIHTWTKRRISGLTWWSNHPFGWTAQK